MFVWWSRPAAFASRLKRRIARGEPVKETDSTFKATRRSMVAWCAS